jgi:metallo-beta-lactamase class B
MRFLVLVFLIASPLSFAATTAPACHAGAKWTEPAPPKKIFGDTYFVGTCGISSILITSPQGDILIDGGVAEDASLVEANIRALGFRVEDVRIILNSHEHFDHVGGLAELQRDSKARVLSRAPGAAALVRGGGDRSDPQFLSGEKYAPVANVERIGDDDIVTLGALALTAHATPAHTPGSTTWTWRACEGDRCLDIVYADSLTAISDDAYRFGDDDAHPGVLAAFRRSIATVGALPCDILVTPHPDASDLWRRLGENADDPLVDTDACRRYAASATKNLDARLAKEKQPKSP